jgi:hypothetical protein
VGDYEQYASIRCERCVAMNDVSDRLARSGLQMS